MKSNTRQQQMALDAYDRVTAFRTNAPLANAPADNDADKATRKKYGGMAHKLPILIHTAGLAQALAFVESRGKPPQQQLLNDLAATVGHANGGALGAAARAADLAEYMLLTRQVLAALVWYKRFAESVLGVTPADAAADDDDRAGEEVSDAEPA
jgi:CRISPR-associated protein Cmr5